MKFLNKIAKSGIFCDKRFEHFVVLSLNSDVVDKFKGQGAVVVSVQFYNSEFIVDVAEYVDGLVRLRAYSPKDPEKEFEVGRLVLTKDDFLGNAIYIAHREKLRRG